jgi:hypothetical protein
MLSGHSELQFLDNVIIIKPKVPLPQVLVTFADFGYPVYRPFDL